MIRVNPREFNNLRKGKLVSMDAGKATGYALMPLEERGVLFVTVGDEVHCLFSILYESFRTLCLRCTDLDRCMREWLLVKMLNLVN